MSAKDATYRLSHEVNGGRISAWFRGGRRLGREHGPDRQLLDLPAYRQLDDHSCGFVVSLTLVQYFHPTATAEAVLDVVQPSPEWGCDQRQLVQALQRFGITARYRVDLDRDGLFRLAGEGVPVAVTVWLAAYDCDHCGVVRGIDRHQDRVYLVNDEYSSPEHGVPWADFEPVWCPRGGGLLCSLADEVTEEAGPLPEQ
jgi:hypothetical protein